MRLSITFKSFQKAITEIVNEINHIMKRKALQAAFTSDKFASITPVDDTAFHGTFVLPFATFYQLHDLKFWFDGHSGKAVLVIAHR